MQKATLEKSGAYSKLSPKNRELSIALQLHAAWPAGSFFLSPENICPCTKYREQLSSAYRIAGIICEVQFLRTIKFLYKICEP